MPEAMTDVQAVLGEAFEVWMREHAWNYDAAERQIAQHVWETAFRLGAEQERRRYREALRQERNRPREQIGWQLVPLYRAEGMVTQAFLSCARCRATIDTMGGPSSCAYCEECAAAIRSLP